MTEHTICTCGKVRFATWRAAHVNAIGMMWTRKASRGMRVYWDRRCRCYHVGRATDHARKRTTLRREMYA